MPMLERPLPIIRPITDLRTKLNDVCDQAVKIKGLSCSPKTERLRSF